MTATHDDTIAELQRANAELRRERNAALLEKATLAEALATRNSEYGERFEQQTATIDVLKVMSASPGDPQPAFDLIVSRARDLCDAHSAGLYGFDGTLVQLRAATGVENDPERRKAFTALYPRPATRDFHPGRAILDRQIVRIHDVETEPGLSPLYPRFTPRSGVAVPLLRDGVAIGALGLGRRERGDFSDSQIALLQTFAEQAVIAITSAETYRALQTRTTDLQASLEYQTATSDVLKVISRSTFDLQPVLDTVAETAARLCDADQAAIYRREGESARLVANFGFPPEYETYTRALGAFPIDPNAAAVGQRTLVEGRPVHVHDVAAVPGYWEIAITLGKQRTSLGVPLLREGETIGNIMLARQRVEPFTDRQIGLVSTFADQAVIAIENTRLITEQREALEQQTATAEVLQVINASPGDLAPVFDAMLEKAMRLCDGAQGTLWMFDGERMCASATAGYSSELAEQLSEWREIHPFQRRLSQGERVFQIVDLAAEELYHLGNPLTQAAVDVAGIRTVVFVALVKDAATLGGFTISRREVRAFSDKHISLLQNFAEQAVIAIENARLLTEQQEALEQQTATAEVLQVINASPGNLAPVFDAILEKAHSLCDIALGSLELYDGERFRAVAVRGSSDAFADMLRLGYPASDNPATRPLIEGSRFSHIRDLAETDYSITQSAVELNAARTLLCVPLRRDETLLGMIASARGEVRPFSEKEIALLENFAAQAVIAIENARLLNEQREALEQQTATAEVLQVINASPGNLAPVFDAMLEKAMRLCDASFGLLYTYDGERFHTAAQRGVPEALARFRAKNPPAELLGGRSPIARLINEKRPVHTLDILEDEAFPNAGAEARSIFELGGARTILNIPLVKDDALQGAFTIYRQEVRAFSDKQIALLENFADQAVIAMENARLITETREALEQQTATAEVLQVINASPGDLAPVFDAILKKAHSLCDIAQGSLELYDGQNFRAVATHGLADSFADQLRQGYPASDNPATRPLIEGQPFSQILDVTQHEFPFARARGSARTLLCVPLRRDDKLLGMIACAPGEVRPFSDKQIALLQNFAAQAVIAMENARLLTEQREALERQTATAEVLQVINASPGNLTPVFDAILEKATRLCDARRGQLATFDGEYFRFVAVHGDAGFSEGQFTQGAVRPEIGVTWARIVAGEQVVHMVDVVDTDLYRAGHEGARRFVDVGGGRTLLTVALRKDDLLLGALTVYRQEVRAFTDKHIELLRSFAAQAVIAMENARLLTEQREALEQQTATAEVLQVINASPGNLTPVFDAILEKARILCEATYGGLMLRDEEGFRIVAARGAAPFVEAWRQLGPIRPPPGAWSERLIRGDTTIVHVIDVRADDIYSTLPTEIRQLYELGGIRTYLVAPLRKDDTILGLIILFRQEVRPFTDKQIALLQNFAAQAVIAIENARLLDEIRQRQEELRITFENMGDGVAMFDETQHLVAWNRKFQDILDVPGDVIARRQTFSEYVRYLAERGEYDPEADPEEHVRRLIEQAGQSRAYERIRPDGRVIEIRHNPVPSGGFVLIYADITERKRNEAEIRAARDAAEEASRTIEAAYRDLKAAQANLIQAEKMASLGQLTAGIAHEIKNPLNFVNNFSALSTELIDELRDVLAHEPLGETARTEVDDLTALLKGNLEKVVQHGQRADGIVRSMLDHSRGSSGERRMVDLNALIDEALNLAYHGARAQDQSFNITLEREFGESIAPVEVNPQDITRVFLNLFSNGFYATTKRAREGGDAGFVPMLKVTTIDAGEAVEIRVRDNGIGIPGDIRDKLFQPFFTTKPTGEGTGLGLSITYDIVTQQHGGSIAVDSKVGDYSEFTIRLPRNP